MLKVAGRPVMDWVMDRLDGLDISELIYVTGHLKEQVEAYARSHYTTPSRFIEQKVQDGTAGAVNLARPFVTGPVMIIFVDTVFEADLSLAEKTDADGIIWAKEVEDYQRFGVLVTDRGGMMTRIVEKPDTPISRLANIGLYYIRDWKTLFEGIAEVMRRPPGIGAEFYLTDAFQYMVDHGRKLQVAEVTGWYDCGKVGTLLATNHHLLEHGRARAPRETPGITIRPPVYIEDGVTLRAATIGPNVTIEAGSEVRESTIENSILGKNVRVTRATVRGSLVGDGQVIEGRTVERSVMDAGELAAAR
jgi:glucose-1-phosphate thymidylyltransferase